jgi:hypothetical protein
MYGLLDIDLARRRREDLLREAADRRLAWQVRGRESYLRAAFSRLAWWAERRAGLLVKKAGKILHKTGVML